MNIGNWQDQKLTLIYGPEGVYQRRALKAVLQEAGGADSFDFESFQSMERSTDQWLGLAGTPPFLDAKRTVVVRNVLRADAKELKPNDIAALPDTACLVLVADEETVDDRQARWKAAQDQWVKAVQAAKGHLIKCEISLKDMAPALRAEAQILGKKLSLQGAMLLKEMTSDSFSRAVDELEKLSLYVGDRDEIHLEDIRAAASASHEWKVFDLVDGIVAGSPSKAMTQLSYLLESGAKAQEAAISQILPMLARQYKLLWQALICLEHRVSLGSVPPSVKEKFLQRPDFLGSSEFVQNRTINAARKLSFEQVRQSLEAICIADSQIKGVSEGYSPVDTIEMLIVRLCDIVRPSARSSA